MPLMSQAETLRQAFGMRFVGLEDPGDLVHQAYRLPDTNSVYPQDVVIDRQGRIAYWTAEYDPQRILAILEELTLAPSAVADSDLADPERSSWTVTPNPFRDSVRLHRPGTDMARPQGALGGAGRSSRIDILDVRGCRVRSLWAGRGEDGGVDVVWDGRDPEGHALPAGVYWCTSGSGNERSAVQLLRIR